MNKRKTRKRTTKGAGSGFMGKLFAQTKLPAHVTEEQDWYLDTPDVRLTRVFTIVLVLHVVAVGGILAFKMIEKATTPGTVATTSVKKKIAPQTEIRTASQALPAAAAVKTPAVAKAPTEPALVIEHPSAPGVKEYQVTANDNLVGIARKLGVSATELRRANSISGENELYPGRWLTVPGNAAETRASETTAVAVANGDKPKAAEEKEEVIGSPAPKPVALVATEDAPVAPAKPVPAEPAPAEAAPEPAEADRPAPNPIFETYTVQKGDTPFAIARKFGVRFQSLMATNGIDRPENLQVGQKLKIPAN